MDTSASSAYTWALREMGFSDFNDERLTQRATKIAASFLEHPQQSIPQSFLKWSDTKATYRFFANVKVNSSTMISSHVAETINRMSSMPTILVAQDTTTINLTTKKIVGLGKIDDKQSKGFFIHSGVAMNTEGIPQGIVYQKIYVRKEETQLKNYREKYKLLSIDQKESIRWIEAVESVRKTFAGKRVVMIGDRESDIYEVFQKASKIGIDLLVRTSWNRRLSESDQQEASYLFDKAKKGKIITSYKTQIPIDKSHKTREATLVIRLNSFILVAPKRRGKNHPEIPLYIFDISEQNPPVDIEPIHWMLTTNMEVTTPNQAREKVQWYMYRWRIERFHFILKTGAFNVEKLQFETFNRFKKVITMYSVVAWRLLFTTYQVRENPNDDAEKVFSKQEIQTLCCIEKKQKDRMTIHEAVIAMAKLGGYLARKSDGPPGVKSLWIGFRTLQNMISGIMMAQRDHLILSS